MVFFSQPFNLSLLPDEVYILSGQVDEWKFHYRCHYKNSTKWNKWLTQKNKNFRAPEFKQKLWNKFKTPDLTTQPNTITKQQLVSNNLRFQFQNPDFHPVSKTNFSQVSKTDSFEQKKNNFENRKGPFLVYFNWAHGMHCWTYYNFFMYERWRKKKEKNNS